MSLLSLRALMAAGERGIVLSGEAAETQFCEPVFKGFGGLGFRGLGFRGLGVRGLGFRVWGLGFRGLGFRV